MTSKHTPGPWVVHDHPTDPYQYGHHVTTADGLTVCSVTYQLPVSTPHGVEEATRVANAHLIAAAPEMLEALRAAWNCILDLPGTQAQVEATELVYYAIAKAKGEA